jgi:hypothetical protein
MKYLNWQAWLIAAALAGCSDAGASKDQVTVGVQLALTGSAETSAQSGDKPELVAHEAQGGAFAIEHARAVVERIELYLPTGDDDDSSDDDSSDDKGSDKVTGTDRRGGSVSDDDATDDSSSDDSASGSSGDKITIRGPFVVDLVDGTSTPEIANVTIPAGHYRRVDVRFSNDGHGKLDASDPLHDLTFVADGKFTPNGAGEMPFNLALDFNEEARFESEAGIDISEESVKDVLLKLDVSKWFSALPVGNCMEEGALAADGDMLVIDERAECSHIERDLKDAIKTSGRLEHR